MPIKNTNKPKIKSFKRYMQEEKEQYYTLDLYSDMTKEDVMYYISQLLPLVLKMLKNSDVVIAIEPVLEGEEQ